MSVEYLKLDLRLPHAVHARKHFAAELNVDPSIVGPDAFIQTNFADRSDHYRPHAKDPCRLKADQ